MKNNKEKLNEIYGMLLDKIESDLEHNDVIPMSTIEALKTINNIRIDNNEQ